MIVSRLFRNRHTGPQEVSGASRENSTLCIVCQVSEFVSLLSFPKKSPRFKEEHKETVSPLIPQESDTRREKGCNVLIFVCSELIRGENFACDEQRVQLDRTRTDLKARSCFGNAKHCTINLIFLNKKLSAPEGKAFLHFFHTPPSVAVFHFPAYSPVAAGNQKTGAFSSNLFPKCVQKSDSCLIHPLTNRIPYSIISSSFSHRGTYSFPDTGRGNWRNPLKINGGMELIVVIPCRHVVMQQLEMQKNRGGNMRQILF